MTVESIVKIGKDIVDLDTPCDVVRALRKIELQVATGSRAEIVEIDGERVAFTRANTARLTTLIQSYQRRCEQETGARTRRRARTVRWV